PPNVTHLTHVAPAEHACFYAAAPLTLNVTRADMAAMGYCPSARIFEAAACGVPVLSDRWEGIEEFFQPGDEILLAATTEDTIAAIDHPPDELTTIGRRARQRALEQHTAEHRAIELERVLARASSPEDQLDGATCAIGGGAAPGHPEGDPSCSA